jgi:hypothetical protein
MANPLGRGERKSRLEGVAEDSGREDVLRPWQPLRDPNLPVKIGRCSRKTSAAVVFGRGNRKPWSARRTELTLPL